MYTLRFDLRVPGKTPQEIADQHRAVIEMSQWADDKGCAIIGLSEHHAAEDGYSPSPLMLAAAVAAVTRNTPILIGAALLPFYDPLRLAEDMITLDHLSGGRVRYIFGIGYRPVEYQLYGLDFAQRGALADAKLERLLRALDDAGACTRMPRVTPAPFADLRARISWGGATPAAARRAGRFGLGFFAQADAPGLRETYIEASRAAGFEPGSCVLPHGDVPGMVFVHPDVEQGWREVGDYLLADATVYARWNAATRHGTTSLSQGQSVAALRAENRAHRVLDVGDAAASALRWGRLPLSPLCGGLPPALAWPYLRRIVDDVMPAIAAAKAARA
ncbi:LLM class flavin-dependent oxidoreductase [Solimonas terrae]|uniref:LLM class flavin-dependent oxidoreductase n=1 Tax=Solimonas terrae TaxID=1396819 RepID=A0A6M2BMT0_9GAMM|nr:LLM class flavin-dependent oxidoreductase [Solimonas terrae]NGY03962.1 LLM class flavin-dependent oxidoreductase [Solimonas terrae]